MTLASFHLKANATRAEILEVNGQDVVSQVRAVHFDGGSGDVGRLAIEFVTDDVEIEGEGIVYVNRGQDLLEFLTAVDPKMLEEAVLAAQDWGSSPVISTLEILRKWASGDTS